MTASRETTVAAPSTAGAISRAAGSVPAGARNPSSMMTNSSSTMIAPA